MRIIPRNVWSAKPQRWSEAAVGQDQAGRIYFFFSRTPMTMRTFAERLRKDLGIVRAMHVEGAPEASLSIRAPGLLLDLAGSYETGFNENEANDRQWPIPNVLGVRSPPVVQVPCRANTPP